MKSKNNLVVIILLSIIILVYSSADAKVTGPCVNCHTMHNSQNGVEVVSGGPYGTLLINNCIGCHTGTNTGANTTPYVYSTSAPTFGVNTLAGGNFYWSTLDDAKGHNVFASNPDNNLSVAPGDWGGAVCGTNSCHANLNGVVSASGFPNLDGRQGCPKCHMVTTDGYPKGYHHKNDGTGTKFVNSASQGWYRFLAGHMTGNTKGVIGIEHAKWNYGATAGSHNEYAGYIFYGGFGFDAQPYPERYTTTAYCTGCHGIFHSDQRVGDELPGNLWVRHPSDAIIPNSGEYASITSTYDPMVPVARDVETFSWTGGPSSDVTPGSDMVMCLSCHVAHGSPNADMLRWDYGTMNAGGGGSGGCFTCHTQKRNP